MNILELLLGQIPEGLFFALFMIFVKDIKTHRVAFTICVIAEYICLLYCFPYSCVFHLLFMVFMFVLLKSFYKEKSQITDIFILLIAYFCLGFSSVICYYICCGNIIIATLLNRFILIFFLLLLNHKLCAIQKIYKKQWNRGNSNAKMKSTTFRSINLILFYVFFELIYLLLAFGIATNGIGGE